MNQKSNHSNIKTERVKDYFIEAAKKIILAEGVEAVSVRKVAEEAGYTFATIYNHFKNADELLWYTRNRMIMDIYEQLQPENDDVITNIDGIKKVFRTYVDYYVERPNVFRFFYFTHLDKSENTSVNAMDQIDPQAQFVASMQFLIGTGKFSMERITHILKTTIYAIHGLLTLYISDNDDLTRDGLYKELDDTIEGLLKNE
jgi:AcrR family transcriptional regulator